MTNNSTFSIFARYMALIVGHPGVFALACFIIFLWFIIGPLFSFSDTWQLVINTGTTIITFLMVFIIQNTQNRDSEAIQIKLDELLRTQQGAHKALLDLEELSQNQLEQIREKYEKLAREARVDLAHGATDTKTPSI